MALRVEAYVPYSMHGHWDVFLGAVRLSGMDNDVLVSVPNGNGFSRMKLDATDRSSCVIVECHQKACDQGHSYQKMTYHDNPLMMLPPLTHWMGLPLGA